MNREKMPSFLVTLRKEKNLLQQDIAEIFMVTPQAVSKWEKGESIPDIETLEKIAKFYDLTVEELLEGERKNIEEKKEQENKKVQAPVVISFIYLFCFLICCAFNFIEVSISGLSSLSLSIYDLLVNINSISLNISSFIIVFCFLGGLIVDIIHSFKKKENSRLPFIRNILVTLSTTFTISFSLFVNFAEKIKISPYSLFLNLVMLSYFILMVSLKCYREQNRLMARKEKELMVNTGFIGLMFPSIVMFYIFNSKAVFVPLVGLLSLFSILIISFFIDDSLKIFRFVINIVLLIVYLLGIFLEEVRAAGLYCLIIQVVYFVLSLTIKFMKSPKKIN